MGFIYKITNTVNGKCYIGETKEKNPLKRWQNHKYSIRTGKGCPALRNAFKTYGEESFTFEIIRECSDEHRIAIEEYYIEQYDSLVPNGYNVSAGGQQGGTFAGHKHSEETKLKQAIVTSNLFHNTNIYDKFKANRPNIKKIVSSYNFNGHLIKTYNSIVEAAKELNITDCSIHKCLTNKMKQTAGLLWAYGNEDTINAPIIYENNIYCNPKNSIKSIIQNDLFGNFISEFKSISNAALETGIKRTSISQMLSGRTKTAGGFIWKYKQ